MYANKKALSLIPNIKQEYVPLFRYAFGSTLLMCIAMTFVWDMAYLTPVLALSFIAPGTTVPSFKKGILFVITIAITTFIGFVFTKFFIHMKLVFIPIQTLAIFGIFYTNKLNAQVKVFMLISLLLIPLLGMQSIKIAHAFMVTFITGACITIVLVWLIFALFPDKGISANEIKSISKANQNNDEKERFYRSLEKILIVLPIVLCFFFFQWTGAVLVLIFVAILSMQETFNLKSGFAMIIGNLGGGILAIIAFQILTMVPFYPMLICIITLGSLFCASHLFSNKKIAPLFGMGFSTFLLITGQFLTSTDDASANVWIRVFQIMTAIAYVLIAFSISKAFKIKPNS